MGNIRGMQGCQNIIGSSLMTCVYNLLHKNELNQSDNSLEYLELGNSSWLSKLVLGPEAGLIE